MERTEHCSVCTQTAWLRRAEQKTKSASMPLFHDLMPDMAKASFSEGGFCFGLKTGFRRGEKTSCRGLTRPDAEPCSQTHLQAEAKGQRPAAPIPECGGVCRKMERSFCAASVIPLLPVRLPILCRGTFYCASFYAVIQWSLKTEQRWSKSPANGADGRTRC